MLWITTYEFHETMDRSKENLAAMMAVFGERGEAAGTIAHYVRADGSGGVVIGEQDDAKVLYETAFAYRQWLEMSSVAVITVDDALPTIMAALA